jgi:hypothetical protein
LETTGRFVDGIKSKLRASGSGRKWSAGAVGYGKVDKTDSMRVEIRSRRAPKLIAKNLDAADSIIAPRAAGTSASSSPSSSS